MDTVVTWSLLILIGYFLGSHLKFWVLLAITIASILMSVVLFITMREMAMLLAMIYTGGSAIVLTAVWMTYVIRNKKPYTFLKKNFLQ